MVYLNNSIPAVKPEYIKTSAPATTPISVAEAKAHLRIPASDTTEDTYIGILIDAAVDAGEAYTRRCFVNRTYDVFYDFFPEELEIRKSPLVTLNAFEYLVDSVFATVSADVYYNTKSSDYAIVAKKEGGTWPNHDSVRQAVRLQITVGYGATATDVPAGIRQALLTHVANLYINRGDCSDNDTGIPTIAKKLYDSYRIISIATHYYG